MICMPLVFAYPCCSCGLPGQLCPGCSASFCSGCAHVCDAQDYEDSPWASEAETLPLGETGGSGEMDASKAANYADLASAYLNPGVWTQIEEGLFLRGQSLAELNTCYIHDGDGDDSRRFGSMRDWRRVADFMAWHHPTIVYDARHRQEDLCFPSRLLASREGTQASVAPAAIESSLASVHLPRRRKRAVLRPCRDLVEARGEGVCEKMHR